MAVIGTTSAFLDPDRSLRRLPRAPGRPRSPEFHAAFEDRALLYDLFWHADGQRIIGIGPPPLNLVPHWGTAVAIALPGGETLGIGVEAERSVAMVTFTGAPAATTAIRLEFGGQTLELAVQPSLAEDFTGRRVLFAINRDNPLEWIAAWARFHAHHHGTDAVIVFDNGSADYSAAELDAVLAAVPGLRQHAVVPVPHRYGPIDRGVMWYRFYARFLQAACLTIALYRFGLRAEGLLSCDIDELVAPLPGGIYAALRASRTGLVRLKGRWVEAVITTGAEPARAAHRDFTAIRRFAAFDYCPNKWILDPAKLPADRAVFAHAHSVKPKALMPADRTVEGRFFHYRGINTNWKEKRRDLANFDPRRQIVSEELQRAWADVPEP